MGLTITTKLPKEKNKTKNKEAQDDREEKQNDHRDAKKPPKKQTLKSNKNIKWPKEKAKQQQRDW